MAADVRRGGGPRCWPSSSGCWRHPRLSPSGSTGRASSRRRRCRGATSTFRTTRSGRWPTGSRSSTSAITSSPRSTCGMILRAGAAADPSRPAGGRLARRAASGPGDDHPLRPGDRRGHRQHRGRPEHRHGTRPRVRRCPRDEGQLRLRPRSARRRGAAARLRAGRDRAAAQPGAVRAAGQLRRSGVHRQRRVQPAGLRIPSLRHAAGWHPGVGPRDHPGRSGGVPPHALTCRTTPCWPWWAT